MKQLIVMSTTAATTLAALLMTAPAGPAAPEPTLGQVWASNQEGYGAVRPTTVFNGGDPTGMVNNITWSSWGGAEATGTGTALWEADDTSVADALPAPATIVAWDLGPCQGNQVYRAVNWYFPDKGQTLNKSQYINICTGTYVGS